MHEFTLANQTADTIIKAALDKGAKKILSVEILLGELNLAGEEQFIFWLNEILDSKGEIAKDVKIDLKPVQAKIKCRQCGYEGGLKPEDEDHHNPIFRCPSCNQVDIEIKKGIDCVLNRVELEI